MPGRVIDRIVFTALLATAIYLALLNTGLGIVPSAGVTFMLVFTLGEMLRRLPKRRRCSAAQAEAALLAIATLPDAESHAALRELAQIRIPDVDSIVPVVRHPTCSLGAETVFEIWKARRGTDRVVIATTCPASEAASALAKSLDSPGVLLLDGHALSNVIRRTGLYVPPDAPRAALPRRLRHLARAVAAHRPGPRALLHGLMLWGLYLLLGKPLYLFCSMAVLFHCGASWIRRAIV